MQFSPERQLSIPRAGDFPRDELMAMEGNPIVRELR
jgi:hypothetical protein